MKKYIAHIIIETTSPLIVGSGKSALDNDAVVAKDFNFLPYIPGTGLTGLISKLFEKKHDKNKKIEIFGGEDEQAKEEKETFLGSTFEISDALLLNENNKVIQNLVTETALTPFHKNFLHLPKREHVKINHRGTASNTGKFDSEFVYKGSRFKFEIELTDNKQYWTDILEIINSEDFILGSGTTNSYGQTEVISVKQKIFDLNIENELIKYLNHTTDLNNSFGEEIKDKINSLESDFITNEWNLTTSAIHIGAGYGDNDTDDANYKEKVIELNNNGKYKFENYFVIPGSSIKGVLAHRTAYYFNKSQNNNVEYIIKNFENNILNEHKKKTDKAFNKFDKEIQKIYNDKKMTLTEKKAALSDLRNKILNFKSNFKKLEEKKEEKTIFKNFTEENNEAVRELFGYAKKENNGKTGNIIFKDIYIPESYENETLFNHNVIDRFTGGTKDTALFSEKVFSYEKGFALKIIHKSSIKETTYYSYFLKAVEDLKNANLAIGGKTNKGYGFLETLKNEKNEN